MPLVSAVRYHDISAGHRVHGQGGKCERLHGHNYRIHFFITANALDEVGRVLDFGDIKTRLCTWLEDHWDHKFLIWSADPWASDLCRIDPSVVCVSFNPTAENMGLYLITAVGPYVLQGTGAKLDRVSVEETRKCSALIEL